LNITYFHIIIEHSTIHNLFIFIYSDNFKMNNHSYNSNFESAKIIFRQPMILNNVKTMHNLLIEQEIQKKKKEIYELRKIKYHNNSENNKKENVNLKYNNVNDFKNKTNKIDFDRLIQSYISYQKLKENKNLYTKWKINKNELKTKFNVGNYRLDRLARNYYHNNVLISNHKNENKVPTHAINNHELEKARSIILELDREPWYDNFQDNYNYIFSFVYNKKQLFDYYEKRCSEFQIDSISYPSFIRYFNVICHDTKIRYPKDDICDYCNYYRFKEKSDNDKLDWEKHLNEAEKRRKI